VAEELCSALLPRPEANAAFPYRLATRRLLETLNSAYQEATFTRQRHPEMMAAMAPDDLAQEGLKDGDAVEISSAHGQLRTRVRSDATLRPGTVSIPHMWGGPAGESQGDSREPFTGALVSLDIGTQRINHTPVQTGLPVQVRPLPTMETQP
jgi:anaerobic selenocysteine-containing dehydrogenase